MINRRQMLLLLDTVPVLKMVGCSGDGGNQAASCTPLILTDEHDCALCGMTIVNYPGPKAQACLRDGRILPFCSVHDMLSWAWQPESAPAISLLMVHDLSRTSWHEPADDAWMPAEDAIYVIGHDQPGAMGHSPAPFSSRPDAKAFSERHGGRLFAYADLNFENFRGDQPPRQHSMPQMQEHQQDHQHQHQMQHGQDHG